MYEAVSHTGTAMQVESLTYDELALRLGITRQSARQLAMRRRWPRKPGNDGLARVSVPVEALTRTEAGKPTRSATGADTGKPTRPEAGVEAGVDTPTSGADARALIAVLESRITELQGRVSELDVEAKQGRAALARVDVLEARLAAEQQRVDEWKAVADRFATQAEKLASAAEARRSWWPWRRSA